MDSQNIFLLLLNKMLPLYVMMGLGVVAGSVLKIPKESISKLLIYIISPAVTFYGAYTIDFHIKYLSLPPIFFLIATGLSITFLKIGTLIYKADPTKNILSMGVGTGNTGYFGFPVVLALFGTQAFSIAVFMQMGITLFESIIGFFILARGHHSVSESLKRMARLPLIYAFLLGMILAGFNISLGAPIDAIITDVFSYFKGAYSMLGMMMIGFGIASCRFHSIDIPFISLLFFGRSIMWPIIIALLITLDRIHFHIFDKSVYEVAVIMALVPLAANLVAYATELKVFPDKAAVAVLLSTLLALFYIPLVVKMVFTRSYIRMAFLCFSASSL